jgi:hypothetical protein
MAPYAALIQIASKEDRAKIEMTEGSKIIKTSDCILVFHIKLAFLVL